MHLDIVYGCVQATMAEMSGCYMTLQNLKYLLFVPLHLKFATPDSEHQKEKGSDWCKKQDRGQICKTTVNAWA